MFPVRIRRLAGARTNFLNSYQLLYMFYAAYKMEDANWLSLVWCNETVYIPDSRISTYSRKYEGD